MRILIVAELDPNVTEHGARESMEEARLAMEAVGDVTVVTVTLDTKETEDEDEDDEELEADDDDGSTEEDTE